MLLLIRAYVPYHKETARNCQYLRIRIDTILPVLVGEIASSCVCIQDPDRFPNVQNASKMPGMISAITLKTLPAGSPATPVTPHLQERMDLPLERRKVRLRGL
jgi:hypothetical protein